MIMLVIGAALAVLGLSCLVAFRARRALGHWQIEEERRFDSLVHELDQTGQAMRYTLFLVQCRRPLGRRPLALVT